jgi:hypothetical protein
MGRAHYLIDVNRDRATFGMREQISHDLRSETIQIVRNFDLTAFYRSSQGDINLDIDACLKVGEWE